MFSLFERNVYLPIEDIISQCIFVTNVAHTKSQHSLCTKECSMSKYAAMHKGCLERAAEAQVDSRRCMGRVPGMDTLCLKLQDFYVTEAPFCTLLTSAAALNKCELQVKNEM